MKRFAVLCAGLVLSLGCAQAPAPKGAGCPMPERSTTVVPTLDTIPVLESAGVQCVIWQDNEGDGHVIRRVRLHDGMQEVATFTLNEDGYQTIKLKTDRLKARVPRFADRHLWTMCFAENEEVM